MCFKVVPYSPLGVGLPQRQYASICFAAVNNFMADMTVSHFHEFLGAVLGLEAVGLLSLPECWVHSGKAQAKTDSYTPLRVRLP